MIINHNMNAQNAHRLMSGNTQAAGKSMEKLSSGLRINRAGDDAAGLAISEKMRGQIRGLDQASRNAQDSISLIQTAEGALNETHSILQRMRELGVQASNDTNTDVDRTEIKKEMDQLKNEIDRIGNNTEFNTKKLLDGGVGSKVTSNATTITADSTTSATKSGVYAVAVTGVATHGTLTAGADFGAPGADGTVNINGTSIALKNGDTIDKVVQKINNYSETTGVKAIVKEGGTATTQRIILQTTEFGSDATVSAQFSSAALSTSLGFGGTITTSASGTDVAGTIDGSAATGKGTELTLNSSGANADGLTVKSNVNETAATTSFTVGDGTDGALGATAFNINGKQISADLSVTLADGTFATDADKATELTRLINAASDATGVTAAVAGSTITLTSNAVGTNAVIKATGTGVDADGTASANALNFAVGKDNVSGDDGVSTSNTANITVSKDNVLKTHIGANKDQTMDIDINDMRSSALKINDLDVTTQTGAEAAITKINDAIEKVSAERSKLGAFQNRLEHTIANLGTSSENLTSAESRIRDVDMAKEMMNFSKNNILSQAAQAMLAQANQQPQGVLQLLR